MQSIFISWISGEDQEIDQPFCIRAALSIKARDGRFCALPDNRLRIAEAIRGMLAKRSLWQQINTVWKIVSQTAIH